MSNGWNSSIPRVIRYETGRLKLFNNGVEAGIQDVIIKSVTDLFFYSNGSQPVTFGNGTRADIPVACPTSNCTWPTYESLGVCSSCVDVSNQLTFGCLSTRVDWIRNLTGVNSQQKYPNGTQCGYFLNITSEMPVLMSGYLVESVESEAGKADAGEALLMRVLPLITNPTRRPLYGEGSINFKHIQNKLQDGIFTSIPDGLVENVYKNITPVVHECMLAWCVKRFNSSYYWANYEEEVIDTFLNDTGSYPFVFTNSTDSAVKYSGNSTISVTSGNGTVAYGVSNLTSIRAINVFDDIFPSFYTAKNASDEPLLRYQTNGLAPRLRTMEIVPWASPNNVTRHMERLAVALTNAIRSTPSKELVLGQAFSIERYVAVRWEWLTLPVGLLLSSFIFLAATIYSSAGQEGVWKTSAIATLIYGLPDDMQKKIRSSTQTGTPRSRAKELKVKLQSKGWRVSGGLLSPMTPRRIRSRPPSGWI